MSALLLTIAGLSSCSSDDDELTGYQATFHSDAYSLGYGLRNVKGDWTRTFKEGENIIFDVTVNNKMRYELHLADERVFDLLLCQGYLSCDGSSVQGHVLCFD